MFDIASTMLGVYGGLIIVLRLLTKYGIQILSKIYQRRVVPRPTQILIQSISDI